MTLEQRSQRGKGPQPAGAFQDDSGKAASFYDQTKLDFPLQRILTDSSSQWEPWLFIVLQSKVFYTSSRFPAILFITLYYCCSLRDSFPYMIYSKNLNLEDVYRYIIE